MQNKIVHSTSKKGTQIIVDMESFNHSSNVIEAIIQLVKDNEDKLNYDDCDFLDLTFGQLNEQNEFIKKHNSQYGFFKDLVEKHPSLMPKVLEYVKLFKQELNPRSSHSAGMFAITVLAETDHKYLKDFMLYMEMCDLNHPTEHFYCIEDVLDGLEWGPEKLEFVNYFINAPGQKHPAEFIDLTDVSPEYFDLIMKEFTHDFMIAEDLLDMVFPNIDTELLEQRFEDVPVGKEPTYKYFTTGEF